MPPYDEIYWFGERGVLNALVIDIVSRRQEKEFLNSIVWADRCVPTWIKEVTTATFLVEPGFAHFGSPDLIVACETTSKSRHVIIVEAKVVPYVVSAIPNESGMIDGFNSCINGQLSLRHRASHALTAC